MRCYACIYHKKKAKQVGYKTNRPLDIRIWPKKNHSFLPDCRRIEIVRWQKTLAVLFHYVWNGNKIFFSDSFININWIYIAIFELCPLTEVSFGGFKTFVKLLLQWTFTGWSDLWKERNKMKRGNLRLKLYCSNRFNK